MLTIYFTKDGVFSKIYILDLSYYFKAVMRSYNFNEEKLTELY